MKSYKRQYRDLEMTVLSALRSKINLSEKKSEFIQQKCLAIQEDDFVELIILDDRLILIDIMGQHYDWSEVSLEVLIDILEA